MKTFIFSLLVLTMTFSFAQLPTQNNRSQSPAVSSKQSSQETTTSETTQTLERLYAENAKLNAELDELLAENARLDGQNYALKIRVRQLRSVDARAAAQHRKMIYHNEKHMALNDKTILEYAVKIEANQEAIQASEIVTAQDENIRLANK